MADTGTASSQPPNIPGVRRYFVEARGVRFHITEAGPADGRPVLLLHGWPQHHYAYRDLLADPPDGMRVIAPDLPGYGWSGPAPHRWAKDDVASDVLALLDVLELPRVLLVGHDWGGYIGYRMVLRAAERFEGYLALNISHPWVPKSTALRHLWRFALYQPLVATLGVPLQRHTPVLEWLISRAMTNREAVTPEIVHAFADSFRDPVSARAATDTYRTFWLHELRSTASNPERRRPTIPIRALFGLDDTAIHHSMAAAETAMADDYTFEAVPGCGHFIADERPDIVRARLVELAAVSA
ncbi:alpha/beta fold hydrolase [Nocardia arthritidis]|uniref:Alpha/beta fold hydrolase n=1 Tax=Nocardia arthritidis TaxID=228602 RepID=A0A6G9YF63_9NOCA|nr:alpha/beta hydrolase [Nocardia arthritidis]QIS11861.1 alpha/beta fold hydrolase [Nocardia arthritidis]